MKRIRQACRILTKESESDKEAEVSQEVRIEGNIHDQWGIAPHHFPTSTQERATRGGVLKHAQSMPFFSREPRAVSGDIPTTTASSRPPLISRHLRKNSKAARLLGIDSVPEGNSNASTPPNYGVVMSPPLLPMDADPFSSRPLGALVIGSGNPAIHTQAMQLTPQHDPQPASLPPSAPVPAERPTAHTSTQHVHASQGAHYLPIGSDAQRIPRSQARTGSTAVGTVSARSRSHPPPISSAPEDPAGAVSQPPQYPPSSTNLENAQEHGPTSTHTTYQADGFGPRVRDAAVTHRKRYQNKYDPAPTPVPRLRKAHSSFVLSNGPMPPLHAPKPLKLTGQPSVEILHVLAESISTETSHINDQKVVTTATSIWPPAPVIRPLQMVMPPRAEQDAFRAAAIEADKAYRKICHERGLVERVRSDRGREARRRERDPDHQPTRHHRRAATENSRRRGGREVEYRTMADYGYYPAGQLWTGRA
ncbi:hypothetical protein BJY52DRAFT_1185579 [Lactarius psammicola]|nr:hypothetical protein BJY52DRAFT_1185579 [Lactarius psammicola]